MLNRNQIDNAVLWYSDHTNHIKSLIKDTKLSYSPSDNEDKNNPNLWKPQHWKWFVETYRFHLTT